MTFEEAAEVVSATRLTGLFRDFRLSLSRSYAFDDGATLLLEGRVPERDSVNGDITPLYLMRVITGPELKQIDDWRLVDIIHHQIMSIARHEADESISVRGWRPFDPHRSPK